MPWIKDFSKGTFSLFAGNVLEGLQPLDFYHFNPLWYDLWISKISEVIDKLDLENKPYKEIKQLLPNPSNIRAILIKIIPAYKGLKNKNKEELKKVTNFFARMLLESCKDDPFAIKSNPFHNKEELEELLHKIELKQANPEIARSIGRIITATGSLVHGLYNDVVTDFGWDVYGPYKIKIENKEYSLLIRSFVNLSPKELWPNKFLPNINKIEMFTLYENVDWEIKCVGCHTIPIKGSPVEGLRKWAVLVDNKPIEKEKILEITNEISQKAEDIYKEIRKMSLDKIKEKVMLQECYQTKMLFDAAKVDWKPDKEMLARITKKPLLKNIVPHGKMVTTLKEYEEEFGIKQFAKEILNVKI